MGDTFDNFSSWLKNFVFNSLAESRHFLFSITRAEWLSLLGTMAAALLAAVVSLYVVYLQNTQQRNRDDEQQKTTEQNKLQYLHFLINDSFKTIEFYRLSVENAKESYKRNPFVIPDLNSYVPHSLNSIANKINQEEYYLASVNQFPKNESGFGIAELLQLCNALNDNYTKAFSEFSLQFPLLIEDKDKYRSALEELIEIVNQYILENKVDDLTGSDKINYIRINEIMGALKNNPPDFKGNEWLKISNDLLIVPLNLTLQDQGKPNLRKIYNQSRHALDLRVNYIGRIYNVVNSLEINRSIQQDILGRIKNVGAPLEVYIKELNKKKVNS
ncbi:hypothetical protein CWM47_29155 [Spirosoma pollinicola]|uniref:Uncharacterized protein n=2 Tax=Spirosoma pollinicola TaxID=2057025 RepID=A0A2K8Z6R1_9BACT|nr:hypothetical protein CWM47_29155 [Spirosoma pollinicola]